MGVYVKGMEMPKNGCDHCFLRTGNYCGRVEKDEAVVEYARKNERHSDCPLVSVPPHGRCVDADKLMQEMRLFIKENMLSRDDARELLETIKDAPTIIPAEPTEDSK